MVVICKIAIDSSLGKQIVGKTNKRQVKINPNYHGVDLIVWNIVFPTLHLTLALRLSIERMMLTGVMLLLLLLYYDVRFVIDAIGCFG